MNEVWLVKNRTSGFTLVELMIVVLLVGLVTLVSTQIPLFSLSSWRKGTERLRMQRDANVAMIRIQRSLRPASLSDITTSDSPYTLHIGGESFFLSSDKTLFYQASTLALAETVIGGTDAPFDITSFDVTSSGDETINIFLALKMKRENVKTTLGTAVKPRN